MFEALRTSSQETFLSGLTSSRESEDGKRPLPSLDGPPTAPSGPDPAPVSLFQPPVKGKGWKTPDTSGPSSADSSPSAALQLSLENRLLQRMGAFGSLEYDLTWKHWDMLSGPRICALRASARRTSGKGFTGWPTPQSGNPGTETYSAAGSTDYERIIDVVMGIRETKNGRVITRNPVMLAGWPNMTASMVTEQDLVQAMYAGNSEKRPKYQDAFLVGWASPAARDWKNGQASQETMDRNARPLNEQAVMLAGWSTPTRNDAPGSGYMYGGGDHNKVELKLPGQAQIAGLTDSLSGRDLISCPAWTEKRGALNPAHSRWLMGYRDAWDACAATVTRSTRTSRRSS